MRVERRSSVSTPCSMVDRTMAVHVATAPAHSHSCASLIQASLLMATWNCTSEDSIFSIMRGTRCTLPCASSSLAAVIHVARSVGTASLAWLSTLLAFSWVSSLARASHISTDWGTHSTALASITRASATLSISMALFQSCTELGTNSRLRRSTAFLRTSCVSRSAALSQILTLVGSCSTAFARRVLAVSVGCNLAASSHTSSDSGHCSHPCSTILRAADIFPANSSTLAAAIQPGPCFGLVDVTDCSRIRAFLMSPTSASDDTLRLLSDVRYPLGSTTVCPDTLSDILSSLEVSRLWAPDTEGPWVRCPCASSALGSRDCTIAAPADVAACAACMTKSGSGV
mmetsp:Transcript_627/g.1343  ORF Transcript_627/g.1343 Transcript_627/m.1343 type:complete len:343 (+) Transcript_627:954-1982(+)